MQKYKIGFALPNLKNHGGPVINISKITNYLRKVGHEVHLFPFGKTEHKDKIFIHTINDNNRTKQIEIFLEKYNKEQDKKQFDIFIANNLRTHGVIRETNIKNAIFLFRQGSIINKLNFFNKFFRIKRYQKAYNNKNIATVSQCLLNVLLEDYKISPKSSKVIYNPFDFDKNKVNEPLPTQYRNLNYIITVSRLVKSKKVNNIIIAFSKLDTKLKLVIIGDGEERKKLEKLVKSLSLENKIIFIGWINNPYSFIKNAKLLVSASEYEGFSTVLLEALMLNTPIVTTNHKCGANEIMLNELSKFLVKVGDINELSKKIKEALNSYPKINLSNYKQFEIDFVCNQVLDLINDIKKEEYGTNTSN